MTRQRTIFWIGLLIYGASFLLVAVAGPAVPSGPARGYHSAFLPLLVPLAEVQAILRSARSDLGAAEFFSLLITGLINPVFVFTTILMLRKPDQRPVSILRAIVLLMIPFSWAVFHYEDLYPREGYFLWIIGMLLVLFSNKVATIHSP